jgi:hypothetical protein
MEKKPKDKSHISSNPIFDKGLSQKPCPEAPPFKALDREAVLPEVTASSINERADKVVAGERIDINRINQERFRDYRRYSNLAYWLTVGYAVIGFVLIAFVLLGKVPEALAITVVGLVLRYYRQLARRLAKDAHDRLDELAKALRNVG